ncbi:MAG: class I SAM-dependent methyltransferase [Psychroserpens sp.]|uniref:class I SAM-dependent methyltransferase n=1 Tax=Psychroserpens sp. TaxID=2020870 RepID=UPI003C70A72D
MDNKTLEHDKFLEIEKEFHDNYANKLDWDEPLKERLSYDIASLSLINLDKRFIEMLGSIKGKKVLDIGSGFGNAALNLAQLGASVTSIDISPNLIKGCKYRAEKNNLDVDFQVMDAQNLKFEDEAFDIILGYRTIHHLQDINTFLLGSKRCLKKGGFVLFVEPQRYNPFVEFGRVFIKNSYEDDRTPTEHPLVPSDIKLMKKTFGNMEKDEYLFLSSACQFFSMKGYTKLFKVTDRFFTHVDRALWYLPFLRPLYWQVIVKCYKQ